VARANDLADALIAEGNKEENSGNLREACEQYRKAVAAAPGYAKAHLNLGVGLEATGDIGGAIGSYERALEIESDNPYANYNLGKVLCARGDFERAEPLLLAALDRKPEFPEALVALFNVHDSKGNLDAALESIELALKQRPDWVGALYNQGVVLKKLRRFDEAEAVLRRVLALDPGFSHAYRVLGGVLHNVSLIADALEISRAGRERDPDSFALESAELFLLNFLGTVSEEVLFARHKAFGERLEKAHLSRFAPYRNARNPEKRLRIGYVSSDFYYHPVTLFLIPVLERRNRASFEIYCYSIGERVDELTRQMPGRADVWRDAVSMSDTELADAINRDGIDILVDLGGHTGLPRLGVFAQQPVPVQASWLGYLNTTGTTRIQYRLCDGTTDPPGLTERLHSETLVRLPHSQWCYRPFVSVDCVETPPLVRNGFVTFGSFNDFSKLSPETRKLWAGILGRVPDSRLVIVGVPEGRASEELNLYFQAAGIGEHRVSALPRLALDEYFREFNAVDIALDTTPYSGGTTTCDALWMGVPVLTVPGTRSVSRSTASILSTLGLTAWIAPGPEDYVQRAAEFARDPSALIGLRKSLRKRVRESPIMDEVRFARDLESAYRSMWRAWCGGTTR
jgi:predicted O-linked N-acetylglucosamine transferase (SPINDLY family)